MRQLPELLYAVQRANPELNVSICIFCPASGGTHYHLMATKHSKCFNVLGNDVLQMIEEVHRRQGELSAL